MKHRKAAVILAPVPRGIPIAIALGLGFLGFRMGCVVARVLREQAQVRRLQRVWKYR